MPDGDTTWQLALHSPTPVGRVGSIGKLLASAKVNAVKRRLATTPRPRSEPSGTLQSSDVRARVSFSRESAFAARRTEPFRRFRHRLG